MFTGKTLTRVGIPLLFCLVFFGVQSWLIASEAGTNPPHVLVADGNKSNNPVLVAQSRRAAIMPQVLYQRAWSLIRNSYYKQDFNNQSWDRWKHKYDGKLKTLDDAHKGIETMLASLGDPYTRFLDKEAFEEEKSQIEAHLFGVGMQLGMNPKNHMVVVISPIEGTPAQKAGVGPGWEIVAIDGKPVKGQSLDQVVKQIRGEKGTSVILTFLVKGKEKPVKLERDEIPIRAVTNAEILPGNVGYIRLDSFISSKANSEMRTALD
ncbi:MAG: PDZ domain-containing protein, partial [Candidatus Obscuribacterales bacterium]|nr:PDZ domain-containing protein [Candidatus Obscuribacterales bacterium]